MLYKFYDSEDENSNFCPEEGIEDREQYTNSSEIEDSSDDEGRDRGWPGWGQRRVRCDVTHYHGPAAVQANGLYSDSTADYEDFQTQCEAAVESDDDQDFKIEEFGVFADDVALAFNENLPAVSAPNGLRAMIERPSLATDT